MKVFICYVEEEIELKSLSPFLSDEDTIRLSKITEPQKKIQFIKSRFALLKILESKFQHKAIQVQKNKFGKPEILGLNRSFSMSHSGNYFCYFFADKSAEIGVDIETKKATKSLKKITEEYFSETEKTYILSCNEEEESQTRFRNIWSLKEAYYKFLNSEDALKNSIQSSFNIQESRFYVPNNMDNIRFTLLNTDSYSVAACYAHTNPQIEFFSSIISNRKLTSTVKINNLCSQFIPTNKEK